MIIKAIDWKLIGTCNLRCLHCYGPPKTERVLLVQTHFFGHLVYTLMDT